MSAMTNDIIISKETLEIVQWVVYAVVTEVIDIFGVFTNIINIVCFVKQGFKETVNISLLGLAISDLGCLLPLIWTNICYNPAFNELDLPFEPIEFQYLTGSWPHVIFARITCWVTAFITLERCLCITIPLKMKAIFTHKRVTGSLVFLFIMVIVNMSPVYYANRLVWKFSTTKNRTMIGLAFAPYRELTEMVVFAINKIFLQFIAFIIIVVCTLTLVFKLRVKSKWRQMSTAQVQTDTVSGRDQKITKMVIVISILFIICFVPVCLIAIGVIVEPEFSIEGRYRNLFIFLCSLGFFLESTNSAINIFIYYNMSTKFRTTFRQLFLHRD